MHCGKHDVSRCDTYVIVVRVLTVTHSFSLIQTGKKNSAGCQETVVLLYKTLPLCNSFIIKLKLCIFKLWRILLIENHKIFA